MPETLKMPVDTIALIRDFELLVLLGTSNTLPIIARVVLKTRFDWPVDFNRAFFDRRPLFGPHKTWRGIAASLSGTALLSWILGFGFLTGFWLAFLSMAGDLISSFIKRRFDLKSGARATGLDQTIESFLPLAVMKDHLHLSWTDCFGITIVFILVEIVFSPIFYHLGFRRRPY